MTVSQAPPRVSLPAKVDLQLTPLIDVVFQLLAFFLVTFRVAAVEGDFALKLPHAGRRNPVASSREFFTVEAFAGDRGDLDLWRLEARGSGSGASSLPRLRAEGLRLVEAARAAGREPPEFQLLLDDRLRYEHALAVIEALGVRGANLSMARIDAGGVPPAAYKK